MGINWACDLSGSKYTMSQENILSDHLCFVYNWHLVRGKTCKRKGNILVTGGITVGSSNNYWLLPWLIILPSLVWPTSLFYGGSKFEVNRYKLMVLTIFILYFYSNFLLCWNWANSEQDCRHWRVLQLLLSLQSRPGKHLDAAIGQIENNTAE